MTADEYHNKDRRKELTQIAYNHIAKKGFEGLRVREVAAEAGINNATLHYYFPTKEDLIKGVVDYMIQHYSVSVLPASNAQVSLDAWEEMRAELEDAKYRFKKTPDQFLVYIELLIRSLRDPSLAKIFKKLDEGWRGSLIQIIEKGIRQGSFLTELD